MAIITSYGRETARVAAGRGLVSDTRIRSLVNDNEASYRLKPSQVAGDSSLVSDKRTYSLVNDNGNIPRQVNRCDIVSNRDLHKILLRKWCMCSLIYARQMRGNCYPSYGWQSTRVAADSSLVSEKRTYRDR